MLTQFEPELVSWLMDAFDRIGVRVITYTAVDAIRKRGGEYVVHASGPIEVAADEVDWSKEAERRCSAPLIASPPRPNPHRMKGCLSYNTIGANYEQISKLELK